MNDLDFSSWICPLPLRDYPRIVLGHGGGGKLSNELVENLFLPAFSNETLESLGDSAQLGVAELLKDGGRLAFSTDSFVVQPLFFRGGNIGDLAVNGTVNDVAMAGAKPLFLSAGFIIEEGFEIEKLGRIAATMGAAARRANVRIVTGDTKVVERGKGDSVFINTSGIGVIESPALVSASRARVGDKVILSGTLGDHGTTILIARGELELETEIESDSAPLNLLVKEMLDEATNLGNVEAIRTMRDPTRGGAATTLNEIALASDVYIEIFEDLIPVREEVKGACEILGLDPLYVANEGKLMAIVSSDTADKIVERMKQNKYGRNACIIGEVKAEPQGIVAMKTGFGGTRIVDMLVGEQLPRIC